MVLIIIITSLPKVIWEESRIAALSHTYAVKSPLVTMACPKFAPKSTPSCGPIPKPHYLPHPWTHPTYDAKQHPDLIHHFSTMHWTDRRTYARTYRPTDRPQESLTTTGCCAMRAKRPNNTTEKLGPWVFWRHISHCWWHSRPQTLRCTCRGPASVPADNCPVDCITPFTPFILCCQSLMNYNIHFTKYACKC